MTIPLRQTQQQPLFDSGQSLSASESILRSLKLFAPMNVLSSNHLATLSQTVEQRLLLTGQSLSASELAMASNTGLDSKSPTAPHVFLLSGELSVDIKSDGTQVTIDFIAGNAQSLLSVQDNFSHWESVLALSDCQILIVDRTRLDAMLCWDQAAKVMATELSADRDYDEDSLWLKTLLESNLFHKLPPYNIRDVIDQFQPQVVFAGDCIVEQGEQGEYCYLLKEGVAEVTREISYASDQSSNDLANVSKLSADDDNPVETLAELAPGSCFGEDALLNKTTRNASVTMKSNGVVMRLHKADFFALLAEPAVDAISMEQAEVVLADGGVWLDVRSQEEFDCYHRTNAFHLPMHLMSLKSRLMDKEKTYLAYCSTGRRAATAAHLLTQQGFQVTPVVI